MGVNKKPSDFLPMVANGLLIRIKIMNSNFKLDFAMHYLTNPVID